MTFAIRAALAALCVTTAAACVAAPASAPAVPAESTRCSRRPRPASSAS